MALSRGLARSGRILRAACEAGRGPEHRHLRGRDSGAPRRGGQGEPCAHRGGARAHDGSRGHADAAGCVGRVDRARVRARELLQDRRADRAGQGGAAARRHLRVAHAERGRAHRRRVERAVPDRPGRWDPGRGLAPEGVRAQELGPDAPDHRAHRLGARGREAVGAGGEHRLRWRGAGRPVRHAIGPPARLRHVRAHPGPLCARPEAVPTRVRGAQDDLARGPARRALGSRSLESGHGRGHHRVRSGQCGRQGDVRAAAPAVGGVRLRVRERPEGARPREAHRRPTGAGIARPGVRTAGGARHEVTLTRLVFAWLPVAVWFVVAPPLGYRGDAAGGRRYLVWAYNRRAVTGRLLEAVVVTLLGSLWFDSLGSGGWWLLFLLIGLLAAYPLRWGEPKHELVVGLMDTVRYLVAGAILAWRLG